MFFLVVDYSCHQNHFLFYFAILDFVRRQLCLALLWTRIWFYKCQLSRLGIYLCYQNYCQEILSLRKVLLVLRNVKERNKQYFKSFLFFMEVPNVKYSERMVFIKYRQNPWKNLWRSLFFWWSCRLEAYSFIKNYALNSYFWTILLKVWVIAYCI